MTSIKSIDSNSKKPMLTPKNTGYAAAGAMIITTARAFTTKKPIARTHKFWGAVTAGLTLLHIGVVEYLHHKYKKM